MKQRRTWREGTAHRAATVAKVRVDLASEAARIAGDCYPVVKDVDTNVIRDGNQQPLNCGGESDADANEATHEHE